MKITIGTTTYTRLDALTYAPETDLTLDSLPINEFQADIHTQSDIGIGQWALLKDDQDNLWAKYWLTYAEHINEETLRVRAKSPLYLMSQVRLPAEIWTNKSAATAIAECMASSLYGGSALPYTLDGTFASVTLSGFVPVQECRTRLQWICLAIGAYVKTYFNDKIEILPLDNTETLVSASNIFYRPSATYNDWVTSVSALTYTFAAGTPATTDKWVEDSQGNTYIVAQQRVSVSNDDVPATAPQKIINIDEMYLLNSANVSGVLAYLSLIYFKRTEADLDVIDNGGAYQPGDKILAALDDEHMIGGYIKSASFSFGVQARARLHLVAAEAVDAARLVIRYMYGDMQLDRAEYLLPLGYAYSITNPYYDLSYNNHRYIFRPEDAAAEGTITEGGVEDEQDYQVALDMYGMYLHIISVDDFDVDANGVVTIT